MKFFTSISSFLLVGLAALHADPAEDARKDLADAQKRLVELRESIASEKPKLAKQFNEAQSQLLEKRRKARIARMAEADRKALLKELEKNHHLSQQDHVFVTGKLRDYGLAVETFLFPGEEDANQDAVQGIRLKSNDPETRLKARLAALEAGIDRLEIVIGGSSLAGEAVAPDGEVKSGTFAIVGPSSWFIADDDSLAGFILQEKGSRTRNVQPGERGEIKTVIGGGEAPLSVDVTGGKALALASIESDPWDIFRKGGFWIWPILGIALFSAVCGLVKFAQIVRIRTPEADWVTRILAALGSDDKQQAETIAGRAIHPVSGVVKQCLEYVKSGPDVVEEVLYEQLIGVQNKLQSWLPFIAVTAATAPLLGLLGTVSGMIRTFNIITVSGTGDAKPLAGGISEALVTTLFGLVVAIPALIIHALLSRRCQGIIQNTEKLGLTLVNGLRGERFNTQDAEGK